MTRARQQCSGWALRWGVAWGLLRVWLLKRRGERMGGVILHSGLSEQHRCLHMRYAALAKHHRLCGWHRRASYLEGRAKRHAAQAILHARWASSAITGRGPRGPRDDHGPDALVPARPRPRPPTPLAAAVVVDPDEWTDLDVNTPATPRTRWFRGGRAVEQGDGADERRLR